MCESSGSPTQRPTGFAESDSKLTQHSTWINWRQASKHCLAECEMRMRKAETSFEDRSRSCLGARGEGMLNGLISKGFVACNSVTVVPHSNKKIKFVHVWSRYV